MHYYRVANISEDGKIKSLRGLYRMDLSVSPPTLDKYEDGDWVHFPGLISASGIGGDSPFHEITEAEANEVLAEFGRGSNT